MEFRIEILPDHQIIALRQCLFNVKFFSLFKIAGRMRIHSLFPEPLLDCRLNELGTEKCLN